MGFEHQASGTASSATSSVPVFPNYLTPQQFAELAKDEYRRMGTPSAVVGHVVARKDELSPSISTLQFKLPDSEAPAPMVGAVTDVNLFSLQNDVTVAHAMHEKTEMLSRRSYQLSVYTTDDAQVDSYTIYMLSPKKNLETMEDREIAFDTRSVEIYKDDEETQAFLEENTPVTQGGEWLSVVNEDIAKRKEMPRKPDQNTVVGKARYQALLEAAESARRRDTGDQSVLDTDQLLKVSGKKTWSAAEEMKDLYESQQDFFTREMLNILTKIINAPFKRSEATNPDNFAAENIERAEWLHRESHSLTPVDKNPQRVENLGAASKRYNSEMMPLEDALKYMGQYVPGSSSQLKSKFLFLPDSRAVRKIDFSVQIKIGQFRFQLDQSFETFQHEPQLVKPTDVAQIVGIILCMAQQILPLSMQSAGYASFTPSIMRELGMPRDSSDQDDEVVSQTLFGARRNKRRNDGEAYHSDAAHQARLQP